MTEPRLAFSPAVSSAHLVSGVSSWSSLSPLVPTTLHRAPTSLRAPRTGPPLWRTGRLRQESKRVWGMTHGTRKLILEVHLFLLAVEWGQNLFLVRVGKGTNAYTMPLLLSGG